MQSWIWARLMYWMSPLSSGWLCTVSLLRLAIAWWIGSWEFSRSSCRTYFVVTGSLLMSGQYLQGNYLSGLKGQWFTYIDESSTYFCLKWKLVHVGLLSFKASNWAFWVLQGEPDHSNGMKIVAGVFGSGLWVKEICQFTANVLNFFFKNRNFITRNEWFNFYVCWNVC